MLGLEGKRKITGFIFVIPVLLFLAIFNTYPIFNAFFYSFFKYDLMTPRVFIGLQNYIELFQSPLFRKYLLASWYYVLGTCISIWILSFIIALLLRKNFFLRNFFRSIYFMPTVLSLVVASIIWKVMFNIYGPVNVFFGANIEWLTNRNFAMVAIIIMSIWKGTGYYMILFLAGLQSIPETYYEAAKIDGASWWSQLRHITLPLLKPTISFVIVISIIIGLKVMEPMFVMTQGGPDNTTKVLTLGIYETSFKFFEIGKASAMSVVMFVLIMIFALIQLRLFRTEGEKI